MTTYTRKVAFVFSIAVFSTVSLTDMCLATTEENDTANYRWNSQASGSSIQITGEGWNRTPVSPGGSGSGGPSGAGG
ncbi:MAG: hypothetical protein Q3979_04070, partial [Actinomycetaceae bacterium]|nr:hypothetical protein [Actinomycetaceae bacterium]